MNQIVKRGYDRFPAIFARDAFDDMIEAVLSPVPISFNIEKLFEAPQGYPTDIIETTDKSGIVTGYEIDVTLAGIPKENVDISIEKEVLIISVNKVKKQEDKCRNYLHLRKGISQRSMRLRYGLNGIDKDKIKADLVDGMLKVELPLAEEAKLKKIEIG